jgi:diaminohydroxyphosphoribosylaminopyrimidine deaminase/5-amino-6-(5-phosphoribosylamino)uracil reductase
MFRLGSDSMFRATSILVEGGGMLAASLLRQDLVDELRIFIAPRLLGSDGIPMVGTLGLNHPHDSLAWRFIDVAMCGTDVQLKAIRVRV